ncbi:MAG: tyrosine-type recombinase/integrase [Methylococcales bacterium]|nr:tyrosine-type recombinase/integrase [Methylococcales bacterium]
MVSIDTYSGSFVVKSALQLAPLVFVRPSELRHAEWEHIDFEAKEWRYLVTKTKTPHIVPLSSQAAEILTNLHPLTGNGRFVFPSARTPNGSRAMSDVALLAAIATVYPVIFGAKARTIKMTLTLTSFITTSTCIPITQVIWITRFKATK